MRNEIYRRLHGRTIHLLYAWLVNKETILQECFYLGLPIQYCSENVITIAQRAGIVI